MGEMMRLDLMKVSPWNCHLRWLNDATLFNRLVLSVILSLQLLNRVHHVLKPFFLLGHWHALTSDRRTPLRSRNHLKSLGARHCRTPSEIAQYWRQSRAPAHRKQAQAAVHLQYMMITVIKLDWCLLQSSSTSKGSWATREPELMVQTLV